MDQLDELLQDAFDQMAKEEYDRRPRDLKEHRFSFRFYWNMHRLMREVGNRPREAEDAGGDSIAELYRPVVSKKRAALLVLLLMLLVGGTVAAAEPLIRWLYNYYIEQYTDHVKVMNQEEALAGAEFQRYALRRVPEGYRLESAEFNETFQEYDVCYVNEEGTALFFSQSRQENGNPGSITSGTSPLEQVETEGFTGYYVSDGKVGSLILSDGVYMVTLSGSLSREALLELADGMELEEN